MSAAPPTHRFTHDAMACTFGLTLITDSEPRGQQIAWTAFDEIDRLEQLLSRFVPYSEIAQLNHAPPGRLIRVSHETLECLQLAAELYAETDGAFDIAYRGRQSAGGDRTPLLAFDPAAHAVAVTRPGVELDLGGLGKGYALDRAAEIVRTWGVQAALIDSGQSTVHALGAPPDETTWRTALRDSNDASRVLGRVRLRDAALAGSGQVLHGPHIIDPRTGDPISRVAAWAVAPTAALADALSTTFAILAAEPDRIADICGRRSASAILLARDADPPRLHCIPPDSVAFEPPS